MTLNPRNASFSAFSQLTTPSTMEIGIHSLQNVTPCVYNFRQCKCYRVLLTCSDKTLNNRPPPWILLKVDFHHHMVSGKHFLSNQHLVHIFWSGPKYSMKTKFKLMATDGSLYFRFQFWSQGHLRGPIDHIASTYQISSKSDTSVVIRI